MQSEFIAAAWLSKKDYTIYWKTQDNDPIDLVAVHRVTGAVIKIDVKTASITNFASARANWIKNNS